MRPSSRPGSRITVIVLITVAVLLALFMCLCCCGAGAVLSAFVLTEQTIGVLEPTPDPSDFLSVTPGALEATLAESLAQRIADTTTSNTDYWILYGQLQSATGEPATRQPVRELTEHQVGDEQIFWMGDEEQQRYWQISAQLHIKTTHAYLFVDTETSFDMEKLRQAADLFETQIYPTNRRIFGSEWLPGIDNDPRMTILVTNQMPMGVAGYFSSADEYPLAMKPHSNEREMIYVTSSYLDDLDQFGQLLSHEFQHMIHWNQDQSESLWINEGLSLLAEEINGYKSVLGGWQFWGNPDMQLTNWAEVSGDRYRNYAASKLFLSYLGEHYGGYEVLQELAADDAYGIDGITNLVRSQGYDVDFETLFANWVAANLINDKTLGHGEYGYALAEGQGPRFSTSLRPEGEVAGWVSQFGADYIEIQTPSGTTVTFEGGQRVRVTGANPHSGQSAWWSNRRNMLSSSITRQVDLEGVQNAVLRFWTWYDIEEHFDYGYVTVSNDGGRTWEILPGTHSTSDDPNKASFGHGYTGKSEGWLEEQVDLDAYAGQQILLRFWYVSDPGLNQPGWLIDGISIPQVGLSDDAEQEDSGWEIDGFVRSTNYLPQSYIVQLVEYGPQITIRRLELDAANRAEIRLANSTTRAVLIVSAATRWTSEAAPYRVRVGSATPVAHVPSVLSQP